MDELLINYLSEFVTPNRFSLIKKIADQRTRYLTVVIENVFQSHNASAMLRTCEGLGVQDVHIIENSNSYEINPDIVLGANKWMTVHQHNSNSFNTLNAIEQLRNDGYRIVATTPHTNDVNVDNFDFSKGKFALLFGTEAEGLSKEAIAHSDEFLKIPMYGFTESFNISVSAGIILHHLTHKIRHSTVNWELSETEKRALHLQWLRNTIKSSAQIEKLFWEKNNI